MSNYTKTTDFEVKDSLPSGDPGKIIKGTEFEVEFDAISASIATKADQANPTFTGTATFADIAVTGTVDGRDVSVDGVKLDGIASNANNYSLPQATSTTRGGVELGSNTVQTVAANSVSATAGKTYAVQLNSDDQMVVNVPWSDTTISVGAGAGLYVNSNNVALYSSVDAGGSTTLADEQFRTVTSSGQTITLPSGPTAGDTVYISVGDFTDTTVARNGSNISGLAQDMTIDVANIGITLVYSGNATQGWRLM